MEGDVKIVPNSVAVENFNPLPPHGGRLFFRFYDDTIPHISIHSLRMEGDRLVDGFRQTIEGFQSTPSAWRETGLYDAFYGKKTNFNPLPPHGGRPTKVRSFILDWKFQSTPSAWRETPAVPTLAVDVSFQSTPSAWRETYCT